MGNRITNVLLLAAIWYVLFASPAYAYFDLGVGTYLVQIVGGFALAVALSVRNKLKWFAALFGRKAVPEVTSQTVASNNEAGKECAAD